MFFRMLYFNQLKILAFYSNSLNRKFDFKVDSAISSMKNSQNSFFIGSIINALKAYECIFEQPEQALSNCTKALEFIRKFDAVCKLLINLNGNFLNTFLEILRITEAEARIYRSWSTYNAQCFFGGNYIKRWIRNLTGF